MKTVKKTILFFFLLFFQFFFLSVSAQNKQKIDSLLHLISLAKSDTQKISLYAEICLDLSYSDPEQALKYCKEGMSLAEKNNYKLGITKILLIEGIVYYTISDFPKALETLEQAVVFSTELKNLQLLSSGYNNIGIVYKLKGELAKSLEYYQKAIRISDSIGDEKGISKSNINIGNIYVALKNDVKALQHYQKALDIANKKNDRKWIASISNNMATCYKHLKDTNLAIECYLKAIHAAEKEGDKTILVAGLNNIGTIYNHRKQYDDALKFFRKSLVISKEMKNKSILTLVLSNMGNLYYETGNITESFNAYQTGLKIAREIGSLENQISILKGLSLNYKKIGDFKNAYKFLEEYKELSDSMLNAENNKQILEMEGKYSNEKMQKEIELKKTQLEKNEAEMKFQGAIRNALILGFVVLLILIGFIHRSNRMRKKINQELTKKNKEIETINNELSTANKEIEEQKEILMNQALRLEETNKELEKLSVVASKTDNAVIILDANGNWEWVNEGFIRMYGYTLEDILQIMGKSILNATPHPYIKDSIATCIAEKKTVMYEAKMTARDGRIFWAQTTLTPIINESGTISKIIAIDSDITHIKETQEELRTVHTLMTESIQYAKLIQEAILPSHEYISRIFPETFVFYRPKDIVSGDFYWAYQEAGKIFLAVADCTGHGVSGAFMSMIGNTLLNEIVKNKGIYQPSRILEQLNNEIIYSLNQSGGFIDNGMDITLCCFDKNEDTITIASANQDFIIIADGKPIKTEGSIYSIGGSVSSEKNARYENHIFPTESIQMIYLYTDGYKDQFGGENYSKFSSRRFEESLAANYKAPLKFQLQCIEENFSNWMGPNKQTDDVLVWGIKITS